MRLVPTLAPLPLPLLHVPLLRAAHPPLLRTLHPVLCSASDPLRGPGWADETAAAALVAGTAIGGGFLALPYTTAPLGFLPSSAGLTACAAVLLLQAAVLADVIIDASVESGEPASLATVSRQAFGPAGARMVASLFAALMITTLTAQFAKGGELLSARGGPRRAAATAAFALCSGAVAAFTPTRSAAALSGVLTAGFVGCLGATCARALPLACWARLARADWSGAAAWRAAPTLLQLLVYSRVLTLTLTLTRTRTLTSTLTRTRTRTLTQP